MSEQDAQPVESETVQPEQSAPAPEVDNSPGAPFNPLAGKVAAAKAELYAQMGKELQPEEPAQGIEAVSPQEEEAEEAKPAEEDPELEKARQALASEKRTREQREEFRLEQEKFREEKAALLQAEEKLENFDFDPLGAVKAVLEARGLGEEVLEDMVREYFYEKNPDHATPEMRQWLAEKRRDRRVMKLERQVSQPKAPEPEPEPEKTEMTPEEYAKYEEEYKAGLSQIASGISSEQFPLSAAYDAAVIEDAMLKAAHYHAAHSPGQGDLTPEQALEAVEEFLRKNPDAQFKAEQPKEEPQPAQERPQQQAPRSLRNRTTAARPNSKQPQTFEEKYAAAEARARAMLNSGIGAS